MLKALEEKLAGLFDNIKITGLDIDINYDRKPDKFKMKLSLSTSNPIEKGSKYQYLRDFIKVRLYGFDRQQFQDAKVDFWNKKGTFKGVKFDGTVYKNESLKYSVKETDDTLDMVFPNITIGTQINTNSNIVIPQLIETDNTLDMVFPNITIGNQIKIGSNIVISQLKDFYLGILLYIDYNSLGDIEKIELQKDYEDFGSKLVLLQVYDENGFNPVSLVHYTYTVNGPNSIYQGPYVELNATSKILLNALVQDKKGFYTGYSQAFINTSDAVVGTQIYKGLNPQNTLDVFTFLKTTELSLTSLANVVDTTPVLPLVEVSDGTYNIDIYNNMALLTVNKGFIGSTRLSASDYTPLIKSLTIGDFRFDAPLVIDSGGSLTVIVENKAFPKGELTVKLEYTLSSILNSKPLVGSPLMFPPFLNVTTENVLKNFAFKVSARKQSILNFDYQTSQADIDKHYNPTPPPPKSFFKDVLRDQATQVILEASQRSTPLDFPKSDQLVNQLTLSTSLLDFSLDVVTPPTKNYVIQEISRFDIKGTTVSETWVNSVLGVIPGKLQRVLEGNNEMFRFIGK